MSRTIKLHEDERERMVAEIDPQFPKYTTQIMNTANQNSQATRSRVVGQMSELIQEYKEEYPHGDFEDWKRFYYEEYDGEQRIEKAIEKLFDMVVKMREAAMEIDENMANRWIKDLVLYKTYSGLGRNEEAIFKKVSKEYGLEYSRSTPSEEAKGIDGYLADQPVSIKPITYKQKSRLQENIDVPIVYYEEYKSNDNLKLHLEELDNILQ